MTEKVFTKVSFCLSLCEAVQKLNRVKAGSHEWSLVNLETVPFTTKCIMGNM